MRLKQVCPCLRNLPHILDGNGAVKPTVDDDEETTKLVLSSKSMRDLRCRSLPCYKVGLGASA